MSEEFKNDEVLDEVSGGTSYRAVGRIICRKCGRTKDIFDVSEAAKMLSGSKCPCGNKWSYEERKKSEF